MLETVELLMGDKADASVIWLHGLGADGHDFAPIVPELGLGKAANVRFIFPHAPQRPITLNGGMVMRGWYDIVSLGFDRSEDAAGIKESYQQLLELINKEKERGICSDRIILAGFSQGGAIALYTATRLKEKVAGVIALSTYLPLACNLAKEKQNSNASTSILMVHGTEDPIVPYLLGEESQRVLEREGFTVDWHHYPMQHSVCPEEIRLIGSWLQQRLG
ncbi:Carboxylesterase 2 [Piscirickettsia salmonis]|uniref:alpha/beta hydrolase n=1 Tax=Piscirickettsia salmonis TaxID=1238 RepID=UPI0012B96AD2|nr:dienelactone hydrolase family protein [Piscirickettsia salmonis]QGP48716.1 Carboxylesterase 2 [Piscirickettsia salmonis]QGP52749.1 Carboxylesterase 2 [Piscirickettsia salmonis]QGP57612.1 Carboxylesterase 2 [Piscirickettsia salmonis]QGP62317.1 Carboxylesterase 2 [Piscirickettsia salmonis]